MLTKLISRKELSGLSEAFQAIDDDNSGFIEKSELLKAVKESDTKITDEEVQDIITMIEANSALDVRKDNKIEYSEFLVASMSMGKYITKEKIKALFQNAKDLVHQLKKESENAKNDYDRAE